jgi:phosphate transport system substrate-binding protein
LVQNKEGQYPKPDNDTFQAAAAYADWKSAPGYYQIITNSPGKDSWPIAATSFILMHKTQDKPQNAHEVLKFFDWSFRNGQKMAEELDYVPLPSELIAQIESSWKKDIKDGTGKPVWD